MSKPDRRQKKLEIQRQLNAKRQEQKKQEVELAAERDVGLLATYAVVFISKDGRPLWQCRRVDGFKRDSAKYPDLLAEAIRRY